MNMYNKIRLDEEHEPAENGNMMENMLSVAKFDKKFIEQRKVFLWGVVDDKSAKDITARLMYLDAVDPGKEIKFYINSPGGVVTSGMVIYDTMQMIKSPVSTICMGMAASMGSILLSGGKKGKRYIRAVDIHLNISGTVRTVQKQQLCSNDIGNFICDGITQKNDPVHHQPAVNVHDCNVHGSFFNDVRCEVGYHVIGISMQCITGNSPLFDCKLFKFLSEIHVFGIYLGKLIQIQSK